MVAVASSTVRVPEYLPSGHGASGDGTIHHYFFDDIFDGGVEDSAAVLSILDALLCQTRQAFPFVRRLGVLTDRGPCYSSAGLALTMPFFVDMHDMTLTDFLHPGPGSGKLGVDGHLGCFTFQLHVSAAHAFTTHTHTASQLFRAGCCGLPHVLCREQ
jgi:hypothetical protein